MVAVPGASGDAGPAGPAQDPANRQLARIAGATRQDPARSRAAAHVGALTGAAEGAPDPHPDTPDRGWARRMGVMGIADLGERRVQGPDEMANARRWSDRRVRGRSGFRDVPMSVVSV